jgi:hypothetical protein
MMAIAVFRPSLFMTARHRSHTPVCVHSAVWQAALMLQSVAFPTPIVDAPVRDLSSLGLATVTPAVGTDVERNQENNEKYRYRYRRINHLVLSFCRRLLCG